jgi:CheY-like chemotaxis protein
MGTRILIADDDPIHRRNIEAMVQRMGYRTILTDGGSGALSFATQRKDIALILLDMACRIWMALAFSPRCAMQA